MTLISDPAARAARAAAKRGQVLAFLAAEVWSSADVLGKVAGIAARQAIHRLLTTMEADGMIRRAPAPILAGQGINLWGVTPHGRAVTPGADPTGPVFEPGRLSVVAIPHHLGLQSIRLRCQAAGWTDWQRGETLGKGVPGMIRPDIIARRPSGDLVAVEYERTIKTAKRYQAILSAHLRAIQTGTSYRGVYYVAPGPVAPGLERMLAAIQTLPGGIPFDAARRRAFRVLAESDFPPSAAGTPAGGAIRPPAPGGARATA